MFAPGIETEGSIEGGYAVNLTQGNFWADQDLARDRGWAIQ